MLDGIEPRHLLGIFVVAVAAGILIIVVDNLLVVPAERAVLSATGSSFAVVGA